MHEPFVKKVFNMLIHLVDNFDILHIFGSGSCDCATCVTYHEHRSSFRDVDK